MGYYNGAYMSLYICQNPEHVPNINWGLWLVVMCQCWFIDWNKYTARMQDVRDGGGGIWKPSVLSAQFC